MSIRKVIVEGTAPPWAHALETQLNDIIGQIVKDLQSPPVFAKADLPTTKVTRRFVIVSDEVGGATTAFWDGSNWLRSQDRAIVS